MLEVLSFEVAKVVGDIISIGAEEPNSGRFEATGVLKAIVGSKRVQTVAMRIDNVAWVNDGWALLSTKLTGT